ncbi:YHYH domain-containing protein [Vulgatibacter sp.]|uniref:YHYH domain-containing protein n=1 Tax=Vulgatibacter sp. TaxID=1971226 RepID=UPI0035648C8B
MRLALGTIIALLPLAAGAHGGGLDGNGGHHNRKTGEYHCHREPCFSNQAKSKAKPAKAKKPDEQKRPTTGDADTDALKL